MPTDSHTLLIYFPKYVYSRPAQKTNTCNHPSVQIDCGCNSAEPSTAFCTIVKYFARLVHIVQRLSKMIVDLNKLGLAPIKTNRIREGARNACAAVCSPPKNTSNRPHLIKYFPSSTHLSWTLVIHLGSAVYIVDGGHPKGLHVFYLSNSVPLALELLSLQPRGFRWNMKHWQHSTAPKPTTDTHCPTHYA